MSTTSIILPFKFLVIISERIIIIEVITMIIIIIIIIIYKVNFSIYLILLASLGPGVHSDSKRNEYQKLKNNVYGK
jgi:hypothetical protein